MAIMFNNRTMLLFSLIASSSTSSPPIMPYLLRSRPRFGPGFVIPDEREQRGYSSNDQLQCGVMAQRFPGVTGMGVKGYLDTWPHNAMCLTNKPGRHSRLISGFQIYKGEE
ncbi:hypothetical protein B0T20DRAFT_33787 [Sordaria brevicollis]|uniref:Uncharacterized protein n=1 Tax=Sordaria brevicollis TaxID=83679 RepID=A0AAE0U8Z1_SORBR|nr:hypothetical protein B0T20DRAFT_33787 [Sordaria brevicollis]